MGPDNAPYIAEWIANSKKLKTIFLGNYQKYNCSLGYNQLGNAGMLSIGPALKSSGLITLRLGMIPFTNKTEENGIDSVGATQLSQGIGKAPLLTNVVLGKGIVAILDLNDIADEGAESLANAIRFASRLVTFTISISGSECTFIARNKIGLAGVKKLAEEALKSPTLKTLDMCNVLKVLVVGNNLTRQEKKEMRELIKGSDKMICF